MPTFRPLNLRLAAVLAVSAMCFACIESASKKGNTPNPANTPPDTTNDNTEHNSSGANISITGQLALGTSDIALDAAIAFPVNGGVFKRSDLQTTAPAVMTNGRLALDIGIGASLRLDGDEKLGGSHVVAVFKDDADRFAAGESLRFINLDTGAGVGAVNIVTSELKPDALDFGELSASGEDLVGANAADADTFDAPQSVIEELASTDDSLKKIRNDFMNTVIDPETKEVVQFVETTPGFTFSGTANRLLTASLQESPTVEYSGFLMYFGASHPDLKVDSLCNTTTGKLKLKTPAGTSIRSGSKVITELNNDNMDPAEQMNSNDATSKACSKSSTSATGSGFGMFVSGASGAAAKNVGWNWSGTGGSEGFDGPIPAGMWTMTYGEGANPPVIAKFDLASAYPLDADGHPLVYVPSVKVTSHATTKVIEKIEIVWYLWNRATSAFERVEDFTAFKAVVSGLGVGFFDFSRSGARGEQSTGIPFPDDGHVFVASKNSAVSNNGWTHDWRLDTRFYGGQDDLDGGNGTQPTAEVVSVGYKMYGNSYSFGYSLSKCYCAQNGGTFEVRSSNTQLDLSGDFPSNSFSTLDACHAALDTKIGVSGAVCR